MIRKGFVGAIGNTPLIELNKFGCRILAKAEFMNPGGSVKDRAALYVVKEAQKQLKSGGTIVEGTAGNTGIGLAHVCNALGYKCVIYMPDTQSREKIQLLKTLGCDVRPVPAVPYTDSENYNHQAKAHAENHENAVWTNQFDNVANRLAHYETTGPEIYKDCGGQLDAFVCATGTGGTLAGVAEYLKEQSESVRIVLADPPGSCLYSYFKKNTMERIGDSSITEGIGQGRITDNLKNARIDDALHVPDEASIETVFRLLKDDGIFVGASSALNVAAAYELAKQLGPGHTIATILCDGAGRYQSRLFNTEWLRSKNLYHAVPEDCRHFLA